MKEFHRVGSSKMTQHELNLQSKCAQCGKTFLHTGDHVYKDKSGGRQRMYCCYTCFRVRAREAEKKAREKFERAATSDQRRTQQLRDQKFRSRERKNWGYKCGKTSASCRVAQLAAHTPTEGGVQRGKKDAELQAAA